jgi:hypothetical protein
MKTIFKNITNSFNKRIEIKEKRKNLYQIFLPIYHEDGDMIDLFIESVDNKFILCDYGLTLQRLSYNYDIDTENKESILQKIITENELIEENGNIKLETKDNTIFNDIMHITQVYAKIGSMKYFKREVVENLFYEMLDDFITKELQEFKPKKKVNPIPERDDLEADYSFSPNGHDVYLFGVKDVAKARLATISCLEYRMQKLNFRGWVINEDFEKLPRKDRSRLTNTIDKQFTTLDDFKASAKEFLERERK